MRIIRSSSVTIKDKTYRRDVGLAGLQGGAGLILLALPVVGLLPNQGAGFWIVVVIGLVLLAGGTWFGFTALVYLRQRRVHEQVNALLEHYLDNDFIYFRNLSLPGQRSIGEIDGVLLGPSGAFVLEVQNFPGEYAVEGDTWYRYGRGKTPTPAPKPMSHTVAIPPLQEPRKRLDDSPTWAAIRAAREVKAWLSVRGLPQVVVQPIVVLGSGHIRSLKQPSAPVIQLAQLEEFIQTKLLTAYRLGSGDNAGETLAEGVVEQIAQRLQVNAD